jgi:hypothetical protein
MSEQLTYESWRSSVMFGPREIELLRQALNRDEPQRPKEKRQLLWPSASISIDWLDGWMKNAGQEPEQCEKLLSLWAERTFLQQYLTNEPRRKTWRSAVVERLSKKTGKWKELILQGSRRPNNEVLQDIRYWLSEADSNPVVFLNLAGVPPIIVLWLIEYWKERQLESESLKKRLTSKHQRAEDAAVFERCARLLGTWGPLLQGHFEDINQFARKVQQPATFLGLPVPEKYPSINALKVLAKMIRSLPNFARKGGPYRNAEFSRLVKYLFANVECYTGKLSQHYWGALTAALMSGFPEHFQKSQNPIRNVKNAYAAKLQGYLLPLQFSVGDAGVNHPLESGQWKRIHMIP